MGQPPGQNKWDIQVGKFRAIGDSHLPIRFPRRFFLSGRSHTIRLKMFFFFDATPATKNKNTPPKINIEPENDGLEDVSPFPGVHSQVPC